jgi:hypothetical protein
MKNLTFFALFFTFYSSIAQQGANKDYFIDNDGIKTACYIDVKEWSRNPKSFRYKLEEKGQMLTGTITNVKEFVVGEAVYVRTDIQVDNTSNNPDSLKTTKSPEWKDETLFLSVLVDGKADLFYCKRKGRDQFFYRVDNNPPIQLVHNLYLIPKTDTQAQRIGTNNTYWNQLMNDVNCLNYSAERLKSLHYDIGVLVKYFNKQNECWGGDVKSTDVLEKRNFQITLKPGIDVAHAEGKAAGAIYEDYNANTGFRVGAEFQFSLPFYHKKLAVWFEPAWQSYSSSGKANQDRTVSYQSFELSLGLRHYFFLGRDVSLFIDAAGVYDLPTECLMDYEESSYRLGTNSFTVAAGAGVRYKRISIAGRYYTSRTVDGRAKIGDSTFIPLSNDYQKISLIVGYRLF